MIITEYSNCKQCGNKLVEGTDLETQIGYCINCQEDEDLAIEENEFNFNETSGASDTNSEAPAKKSNGFLKSIIIGFIVIMYFMIAGAAGFKHGGGFLPMFCLLLIIQAIRKI